MVRNQQSVDDIDKFALHFSPEKITDVLKNYPGDLRYESEIHNMVFQQMQSGGKGFRAIMPLLVAKCSNHAIEAVIPWAIACEVLHNASLIVVMSGRAGCQG